MKNSFILLLALSATSQSQAFTAKAAIDYDNARSSFQTTTTINPTSTTDLTVIYDLGDTKLLSGQRVYLSVPTQYHSMSLDFAAITHRQAPRDENECGGGSDRDCLPGYTSLEFLDAQKTILNEAWQYWGGSGSGPFNSKFAEIRSGRGETDNLYEWRKKGRLSVETNKMTKDALYTNLVRIRSVGPDMIRVQKVILKFLPPQPSIMNDVIFSHGFAFGDYATSHGRAYPGNADYGDYGNAVLFHSRHRPRHNATPSNWTLVKGGFRIPLQAGDRIQFVDVAIGDMKPVPRGADPEDYRGGAYLNVKRLQSGQSVETLMNEENVGSNGVMRALPAKLSQKAGANEELEITVSDGAASVMGIRFGISK